MITSFGSWHRDYLLCHDDDDDDDDNDFGVTIDTSPVAGEEEAFEVVKAPRFQTMLGDSTTTWSKQT